MKTGCADYIFNSVVSSSKNTLEEKLVTPILMDLGNRTAIIVARFLEFTYMVMRRSNYGRDGEMVMIGLWI